MPKPFLSMVWALSLVCWTRWWSLSARPLITETFGWEEAWEKNEMSGQRRRTSLSIYKIKVVTSNEYDALTGILWWPGYLPGVKPRCLWKTIANGCLDWDWVDDLPRFFPNVTPKSSHLSKHVTCKWILAHFLFVMYRCNDQFSKNNWISVWSVPLRSL